MAETFAQAAELAKTFEYWNAAGVLIVHAAIALTDAITVKVGGVKSASPDHAVVADILEEIVAIDAEGKKAVAHLRAVFEGKSLVSHSGHIYNQEDIRRMSRHAARYQAWARQFLSG